MALTFDHSPFLSPSRTSLYVGLHTPLSNFNSRVHLTLRPLLHVNIRNFLFGAWSLSFPAHVFLFDPRFAFIKMDIAYVEVETSPHKACLLPLGWYVGLLLAHTYPLFIFAFSTPTPSLAFFCHHHLLSPHSNSFFFHFLSNLKAYLLIGDFSP
jgi:hypothetical protein